MGSRSSNTLLHETETLWGRTHEAYLRRKICRAPLHFSSRISTHGFTKDSQTLNAENNAKWFIRKTSEDKSRTPRANCTASCAASWSVEKCKRSPLRALASFASPRRKRGVASCTAG